MVRAAKRTTTFGFQAPPSERPTPDNAQTVHHNGGNQFLPDPQFPRGNLDAAGRDPGPNWPGFADHVHWPAGTRVTPNLLARRGLQTVLRAMTVLWQANWDGFSGIWVGGMGNWETGSREEEAYFLVSSMLPLVCSLQE